MGSTAITQRSLSPSVLIHFYQSAQKYPVSLRSCKNACFCLHICRSRWGLMLLKLITKPGWVNAESNLPSNETPQTHSHRSWTFSSHFQHHYNLLWQKSLLLLIFLQGLPQIQHFQTQSVSQVNDLIFSHGEQLVHQSWCAPFSIPMDRYFATRGFHHLYQGWRSHTD